MLTYKDMYGPILTNMKLDCYEVMVLMFTGQV
jgi:hypothetical protein